MENTKQFIEDAIEGGLNGYDVHVGLWYGIKSCKPEETPYSIFLDPKAWQAVGKTRGWADLDQYRPIGKEQWKTEWRQFIDALSEGKTIEGALGEI